MSIAWTVFAALVALVVGLLWWLNRPFKEPEEHMWVLHGLKDDHWYVIRASSDLPALVLHVMYLQDAYEAYKIV